MLPPHLNREDDVSRSFVPTPVLLTIPASFSSSFAFQRNALSPRVSLSKTCLRPFNLLPPPTGVVVSVLCLSHLDPPLSLHPHLAPERGLSLFKLLASL
jgi:hypothetical protein